MVKNLCVAEKYTDKNGNEKLSWNRIGVLFESKGKEYMKLYTMPGILISVFAPKPKEQEGDVDLD